MRLPPRTSKFAVHKMESQIAPERHSDNSSQRTRLTGVRVRTSHENCGFDWRNSSMSRIARRNARKSCSGTSTHPASESSRSSPSMSTGSNPRGAFWVLIKSTYAPKSMT